MIKNAIREVVDLAQYQWRGFVVAIITLTAVYISSLYIRPGLATAVLVTPACIVVFLTCFAWLNDLGPERMGWVDQLRRIGLTLLGAGSVMLLASAYQIPVSWRGTVIMWGIATVFLTTTEPPWLDYMTGKYREANSWRDHWGRFSGAVSRMSKELSVAELSEAIQRKAVKEDAEKPHYNRDDAGGPRV